MVCVMSKDRVFGRATTRSDVQFDIASVRDKVSSS
jgi:hypothetical protein